MMDANRFERLWRKIKARRWRSLAITLAALIALDSLSAWTYVLKRHVNDQPFTDLIEGYAVLRPFRRLFPSQYTFPKEWWGDYRGETTFPAVRRRWFVADTLLGHRLAPNIVVSELTWTYYATNAQGFTATERSREPYRREKSPDTFRIIVLGGSTVHGDGGVLTEFLIQAD
jgi:hypothetical protein